MEFFKNIVKSVYDPKYYSGLETRPFSYSLKYYLLLSLLVAIAGAIVFSFTGTVKIKSVLDLFTEQTIQSYPEGLAITIEDGKASSNVQEPYFIKLPEEWKSLQENQNKNVPGFENILVIDTKGDASLENFMNYKAFCVLTEKNLICYGENQSIQINSLASFPNITIDKALISSSVDKIKPFFKLLYPVVGAIAIIAIFFTMILHLVYLLFGALLIWIVAKIKKAQIGYKKSYQLGLHLMTASIIVGYLATYASSQGINIKIPYLFSIILIIMALVNLKPETSIMPVEPAKPAV